MGRGLGLDELYALEQGFHKFLTDDKKPKKRGHWYEVVDFENPRGKYLNTTEMVKYSKKQLSINKRVHGLDKEVLSKDLSRPINAWLYLKNVGIGQKTNRNEWY